MSKKDIKIRRFVEADAQTVSNIIKDTLIYVNSKDYPKKVIEYMCGLYTGDYLIKISKERDILVALAADKILGTVSIEKDTIYTVFISKENHGYGIGKALMTAVEQIARERGCSKTTVPASITAQQFYSKLGYVVIEEVEDDYFGKGIIMEKNLDTK